MLETNNDTTLLQGLGKKKKRCGRMFQSKFIKRQRFQGQSQQFCFQENGFKTSLLKLEYILHWNLPSSGVGRIILQGQYIFVPCLESIKEITMFFYFFLNPHATTLLKSYILFLFGCLACGRYQFLSHTKCSPKDFLVT